MLYGANGQPVSSARVGRARPEPNQQSEERIRTLVKSMDSLLDIKWFPYAFKNEVHNDYEGRYGLICQWPQGDPKWALYQNGETEECFDLLGWFCEDFQNAESIPVDPVSVERKVIELLGKSDNTRVHWKERMRRVLEKNAKRRADIKAERNEAIAEMVEVQHFEHKGRSVFPTH